MAVIGEAVYKISYDQNTGQLNKAINSTESALEASGKSSGAKWANAWSIAAGSLISKGISKIASTISGQLDSAISRVDTLNRFPKIMQNLGISTEESNKAITKMSEKLQGLPTTLDQGASAVKRFTSKNGDVQKSTDIFLALNNALLAGGASTQEQASALEQLSQAYAKGKPDMFEWKSAMNAMPAQLNQVAKAMGLGENAASELGEALRSGEVSMDDFLDTIVEMNGGLNGFEKQAKNSTGGIQTAFEVMKSRITQGIAEIINTIGAQNISEFLIGIGNTIKGLFQGISEIFTFISENQWVLAGIGATLAPLIALDLFGKLLAIKDLLLVTNTVLGISNLKFLAISAAIGLVAAGATWVIDNWSGITQFFGDICQGVGQFFAGIWEGIAAGAQNVWNFITNLFGNLASFFGSIFSTAWNAVKAVFSTGGRIFTGIVDGIINGFKSIVNGIIGGINKVVAIPFNAINGILNGLRGIDILGIRPFGWLGTIGVPQIPRLATGGIVPDTRGGRMILAGEGGQDEWVVPESKMASLLEQINDRGGGNITVNVYGTFATSSSEQRKVAEVIAQRIQEIQKSRLEGVSL